MVCYVTIAGPSSIGSVVLADFALAVLVVGVALQVEVAADGSTV